MIYVVTNFGPCPEALSRLNVVIRHPNAMEADYIMAYDNAVSALGKICQFHRDSIDSAQVHPDLCLNPPLSPILSYKQCKRKRGK